MDLQTIIAGVIGGAIVLAAEQIYLHLKESRQEKRHKLVTFPNSERIIDKTIFDRLSPGRNVELMKTALGTPDKTYPESDPVFQELRAEEADLVFNEIDDKIPEEDRYKTTAYFYDFKNAQVKITSKNRETIDSLAIEVKEGTIDASDIPLSWAASDEEVDDKLILGKTLVKKDLVESSRLEYVFSRFDNIIILSVYTGSPFYTHYTYTGNADFKEDIEISKDNPESFIGGTITGICLHIMEYECYIIRGYDNM